MLNAVGFYAVLTYMPNYLETVLLYDPGQATLITNIVLVVYIGFIFFSGHISDTFGRKKMLIIACVGFIVLTVPAFMAMGSMNFVVILLVELLMALLLTINDGTLSSYLNENVPDGSPLLRLRLQLQPGERHFRRICFVHLVLPDRPDGQQPWHRRTTWSLSRSSRLSPWFFRTSIPIST